MLNTGYSKYCWNILCFEAETVRISWIFQEFRCNKSKKKQFVYLLKIKYFERDETSHVCIFVY